MLIVTEIGEDRHQQQTPDGREYRTRILEAGSDRSAIRAREDYVKAIYRLAEGGPVRAVDVARHLAVSPVSVHKAKLLLERDGLLVSDEATKCFSLTDRGRELALAIVRRHRLIETFLHRTLGVSIERIHGEAERIEHVISDDLAERFARHLGFPEQDPHGHRIPYSENAFDPRLPSLASISVKSEIHVVSVDDDDPEIVRKLVEAGILPGVSGTALPGGDASVRLCWGANDLVVPYPQAAKIRIASGKG